MSRPRVECACCGLEGEHQGSGYITSCYHRWRRAGYPAEGPPPAPLRGQALRDEYQFLRDSGETHETATRRLGVSKSVADKLRRDRDGRTRPSLAERRRLRTDYLRLRAQGVGRHDAIKQLRVSLSATYRWEPGEMHTRPRKVSA